MLIEILYVVFWIIGALGALAPGPWQGWPHFWPGWTIVMFALTGLALFDGFGSHIAMVR